MKNIVIWLIGLLMLLIPYFGILFTVITTPGMENWLFTIQILPYLVVISFGIYAAVTILYRTLTIKDCPEAAKQLYEEIKEARKDLISRGFQFRD